MTSIVIVACPGCALTHLNPEGWDHDGWACLECGADEPILVAAEVAEEDAVRLEEAMAL